jgi:hypothetical protein
MADCELLQTCIFFNDKMKNMPGTAAILKGQFCKSDNSSCARYTVFKALGRQKVPTDLFPQQKEKAEKIIAGG